MKYRRNFLVVLLVCFSFGLFNSAYANPHAEEKKQVVPDTLYGKVTEVLDVKGYTYAEVDTGEKKVWAAAPTTKLEVGEMIRFSVGMPMEKFLSKSLNREFPILYFSTRFVRGRAALEAMMPATATAPDKKEINKPAKNIKKLKDGNTIDEIYANKRDLEGKTMRIRARVTKFSSEIMGKNWLHIKDSSTAEDLTITTNGMAEVDDVVVIEGKLELDKDYGYGYLYPVIVVDAKITKE